MSSGVRLNGSRSTKINLTWEQLFEAYSDILPPYPGIDTVPTARVPDPPLLTAAMSKPRQLRLAALGYRAAVEREYGDTRILVEATYRDPRAVLSSKHADTLVTALPLLLEYRIAPAAWTAFSIHVWKNYVMRGDGKLGDIPSKIRRPRRNTPPPPKWVFSGKRLEERSEWFIWHEATCRGGQLRFSKAHRELGTRHRRLREALRVVSDDLSHDVVRGLVAEHLPPATYKRLLADAKAHAEFEQDRLEAEANAGVWLRWWG